MPNLLGGHMGCKSLKNQEFEFAIPHNLQKYTFTIKIVKIRQNIRFGASWNYFLPNFLRNHLTLGPHFLKFFCQYCKNNFFGGVKQASTCKVTNGKSFHDIYLILAKLSVQSGPPRPGLEANRVNK